MTSPLLLRYTAIFLAILPAYSLLQRYGERVISIFGVENPYWPGVGVLIVYTVFAICALIASQRFFVSPAIKQLTDKRATIALLIFILITLTLFFVIYPYATSGAFGGGSDRDEGLNIAVLALLNGSYPYYEVTFVPGLPHQMGLDGNPISPMPGELLLSIPFVLMGNGAYQSFFWMPLAALSLAAVLGSWRIAVCVTIGSFLVFPNMLHEVVTGGDLLVNSFWIFCGVVMLSRLKSSGQLLLSAIFLGVALSSRLNFLLIAPFVAGICYQRFGLQRAIGLCGVVAMSYMVVTVPFYLYDPAGFSPLHAYSKLGRFDSTVPYAGLIIPFISGIYGLACMVYLQGRSVAVWYSNIAVVLAIPVLAGTILLSMNEGGLNFREFNWYGMSWVLFALSGFYLSFLPPGAGQNLLRSSP